MERDGTVIKGKRWDSDKRKEMGQKKGTDRDKNARWDR